MGEPVRCETHRVVLTASGTCVLCERRASVDTPGAGLGMGSVVAGVVAVLLASAVGYRVYGAGTERRATVVPPAAVRVDPAVPATAIPVATVASAGSAQADYELRVADAQRSVQIDLYGEGWCPSCRKARGWLDKEGIGYTYRDTSDNANKRTMRTLNPNSTIPTINIEGSVIVGFDSRRMRAAIRHAAEARVAQGAR